MQSCNLGWCKKYLGWCKIFVNTTILEDTSYEGFIWGQFKSFVLNFLCNLPYIDVIIWRKTPWPAAGAYHSVSVRKQSRGDCYNSTGAK